MPGRDPVAEAMLAAGDASDGHPADEDALDFLAIIEAMSAHFHEHTRELLAWPWKLFCAEWVRLIAWAAVERERQAEEEREREFTRLRAAHQQR